MGGKKSVLRDPLGSVGKKLGIGKGTLVGDALRFGLTGGVTLANEAATQWAPEAIGEITGANAARKAAMDQQQAAREEALRQSRLSDAMAKNTGGDPTNIYLGSGRGRRRGGRAGSGSSGTQTSTGTGIQNV